MIAAEVKKVREQFADYDELKAAATDADKSKSQLDKVSEQLAALTSRAEKAEFAVTRNEVIRAKGLSAKQARRLTGSTQAELEADADDLLESFPEKPGTGGSGTTGTDGTTDGGDTDGEQDNEQDGASTGSRSSTRGRPREQLRSGTPVTTREPEETDPMKLAALIPRR